MRHIPLFTFALASLLNLSHVYAAECSAQSGPHIVPLLELYTSEGCSSCPPADKWLSALDVASTKVTPLAFHVDYWNYIGWQDQFSKPEYSTRQRKLAAFNAAGFVYTPQFVLNGKDFKGWDQRRLQQATDQSKLQQARAQLQLDAKTLSNGDITLTANASTQETSIANRSDIFVALYQNQLVSHIKAGENNGRELHHDYVVRDLFGAYQMNRQQQFVKQFNLKNIWNNRNGGAVIFVQDSLTGEILQSLALKFCH
ncbi:MAG: DUF1223 domain-containing protein [Methylophilaceae bacterium 17-44-8]|nr:MAG: DUF1223 domain-containing protein [Methylophilales bacterium 28-44-11]OYZ02483.1 MAG: DUF1223 domain-containing protein [Methylophilales bacterium 16-45-7]OZA04895.1 MAG: DUF1223 domain-containing protein [Methylophilaceae bacterium 17-44-8]